MSWLWACSLFSRHHWPTKLIVSRRCERVLNDEICIKILLSSANRKFLDRLSTEFTRSLIKIMSINNGATLGNARRCFDGMLILWNNCPANAYNLSHTTFSMSLRKFGDSFVVFDIIASSWTDKNVPSYTISSVSFLILFLKREYMVGEICTIPQVSSYGSTEFYYQMNFQHLLDQRTPSMSWNVNGSQRKYYFVWRSSFLQCLYGTLSRCSILYKVQLMLEAALLVRLKWDLWVYVFHSLMRPTFSPMKTVLSSVINNSKIISEIHIHALHVMQLYKPNFCVNNWSNRFHTELF